MDWRIILNPTRWNWNSDQPMPMPWDIDAHPYLEDWPEEDVRKWWYARNPLHDLTWYGIGVVGKRFQTVVLIGDKDKWDADGLYAHVLIWGILPLPFIALHRKSLKLYVGWRPKGNFGAKLNL